MANQKDRGGDKEAFLIMAGAYALAFRAETGRKPESNDRPLTPSQNLPLWIHIFSRLSKDGSTLEKAMSVAEKNVARAGLTGSHSITDVLSVNIAVVRDPLLDGEALREQAALILRATLDVAQGLVPNSHNLSVATLQSTMTPIYLDLLLAQLGGENIRDIELKSQSTERLAEMVLLRRHGIDPEVLKADSKNLVKAFVDAAEPGSGTSALRTLRSALIRELQDTAAKPPANEPQ